MSHVDFTSEMMEKQIARLGDLQPTKKGYDNAATGVPIAAYEMLAARDIYLLMAPEGRTRGASKAAITGAPGLEVSIVDCPPGNGAALHAHERTHESFMPLTGRFELTWGEHGEHSVVLQPFELLAVPPGLYRSFRNIEDHDAKMLALIQGAPNDAMSGITYEAGVGARIEERFGADATVNMARIGIRFATTEA